MTVQHLQGLYRDALGEEPLSIRNDGQALSLLLPAVCPRSSVDIFGKLPADGTPVV